MLNYALNFMAQSYRLCTKLILLHNKIYCKINLSVWMRNLILCLGFYYSKSSDQIVLWQLFIFLSPPPPDSSSIFNFYVTLLIHWWIQGRGKGPSSFFPELQKSFSIGTYDYNTTYLKLPVMRFRSFPFSIFLFSVEFSSSSLKSSYPLDMH